MMRNDGQTQYQNPAKFARRKYAAALRRGLSPAAFLMDALEPRTLLSGDVSGGILTISNGNNSHTTVTSSGINPLSAFVSTVGNTPDDTVGTVQYITDPNGSALPQTTPLVTGEVSTTPLPGSPSNVGASNNLAGKVTVIWVAGSNATAYEVFRSQTNDSTTAVQINPTDIISLTYDDTTAVAGVTYFYWVESKNAGGISPLSTSAAGLSIAVPNTPTLGTTTADSTSQVTLSWTDNASSASPISFFLIDRATDPAFTQNLVTLQTGLTGFYNDAGLSPGTTYYYRVYAHNPAGNSAFTAASTVTTNALRSGLVFAWGENNVETTIPSGLTGVVSVTGGLLHSVALLSNGTVTAWGDDTQHQTDLPGGALSGIVAISAGNNHTLALTNTGTVVAWGSNLEGQSTVPTGLTNVIAIAAGSDYSLALESDGTVVAWGDSGNATGGAATVPGGLVNVAAIAAGGSVSLALLRDGTVVAWGDSGNTTSGAALVPGGLSGVIAVAEGTNFSLALKQDGTITAWGNNTSHQTDGTVGLAGITAIAAAGLHGLAIKSDGTVAAWGDDSNHQTEVTAGLNNVVSIAGGLNSSLAVVAPPLPPTAFATDTIFESATVSWTAAPGATAYEVWRSTTNDPSTAVMINGADVTGTTYTDSNGSVDTGYFYWIKAKGLGGTSGFGTSGEGVILGANGRFVSHIYEDLLARNPDAPGLLFWTDAFTAGTKTTADLASGFLDSTEYRTDLIDALYQSVFNRGADPGGLTFWLNFFAGGGTYEQVKAGFYGSAEYFTNQGNSVPALIDSFYVVFLGRHAEPNGLTYWEGKISSGQTNAQVALGIESQSLEGSQDIVNHTYQTYLHRDAEPAGLAYWTAMLQAGKSQLDITFGFLTSPEYFSRA